MTTTTRYVVTMIDERGATWYLHLLQPLTTPSWSTRRSEAKTYASASGARRAVRDRLARFEFEIVPVTRIVAKD
jgi:hypothetical protein